MTNQEALKSIIEDGINLGAGDYIEYDALVLAKEALEKQIPKKIDFEMNFGDCTSRFICGCGKRIVVNHDRGVMDNHNAPNYCPNCGQALNWK